MKLSKSFSIREKVLLAILALLLLFAAYLFAVQQPVTTGIESARAQIDDLELNNTILQSKVGKLQTMKRELEQIKASGATAVIPPYDNLYNEMAFLNTTLAKAKNFQLNFDPLKTTEDSNIVRRTGQMEFTCDSYADAREIIYQLENCPYLCRISSLVISTSEGYSKNKALAITDVPVDVKLTETFFERIE